MRPELNVLLLDDYLEATQMGYRTTFTRIFPATDQLPEVTVGLGLLLQKSGFTIVERIPAISHSKTVMLNTFLNEVAEQYLALTEKSSEHWQEMMLLELGYVDRLSGMRPSNSFGMFSDRSGDDFALFSDISGSDKRRLCEEYGFHKIAVMVAYGHGADLEHTLHEVEKTQQEASEDIPLSTLLELLDSGIPVDDLVLAAQLPPDMRDGIYGE